MTSHDTGSGFDSILKISKNYQPRPQDVVFKNGNFINSHPGSQQLCLSVIQNINLYQLCTDDTKIEGFIFGIISTIVGASPSGIFVERNSLPSKEHWRIMTVREVFAKIKYEIGEPGVDYSGEKKGNQKTCTQFQKMIQLLFLQQRILRKLLHESDRLTIIECDETNDEHQYEDNSSIISS